MAIYAFGRETLIFLFAYARCRYELEWSFAKTNVDRRNMKPQS